MNNTEDVEDVIWFLNPDEDETDETAGCDVTALKKHKARVFEGFSPPQAAAVARWLQLAAGWDDLQLRLEQVQTALRFWRKKGEANLHTAS
jgi:hypothetical protein